MYIGIDMHKETCYATTLDKEGEIVDRREFKNEREEWEKFVEGIPRDSKVAIEACSYWYPVCDFLEERGIEMVLSHPSKTRIIAEAKIKTDKIDSKNLAKLLRADFLPQSYIPSKEIRENRELLRLRVQLGKDRTVVKNRIHALMAKNGVKHEFSDLFGVEGRIFLKEIELAESQRIARDVLLRQLESVDKEVEYVQKRIAIVAKEDEVVIILMTIPGIDYYSAMIIRKFYLRLKKQKGTKIAVVATARKLLRVIYCMLTRKENYRYERKALTESKLRRLEKTTC